MPYPSRLASWPVRLALVGLGLIMAANAHAQGIPPGSLAPPMIAFPPASAVNGLGQLFVNGIAVTSTDGLTVTNTTAATAGVTVQMSPRLKWCGSAWNSTSTLSETDCMFTEVLPATVAGTTTQTWKLGSIINGGAATYPFTLSSAGLLTLLGGVNASGTGVFSSTVQAGNSFFGFGAANANGTMSASADGSFKVQNSASTIGSTIKVDALPTVSSGFGGSPSITAGSTPLAGSVNVGTGGAATSGVINFNGTAFPSAPFCVANDSTTTLAQRATASTTQLTITSSAWTASDIVTWVCISSK